MENSARALLKERVLYQEKNERSMGIIGAVHKVFTQIPTLKGRARRRAAANVRVHGAAVRQRPSVRHGALLPGENEKT